MTTDQRLARAEQQCRLVKAGFRLVAVAALAVSLIIAASACTSRRDRERQKEERSRKARPLPTVAGSDAQRSPGNITFIVVAGLRRDSPETKVAGSDESFVDLHEAMIGLTRRLRPHDRLALYCVGPKPIQVVPLTLVKDAPRDFLSSLEIAIEKESGPPGPALRLAYETIRRESNTRGQIVFVTDGGAEETDTTQGPGLKGLMQTIHDEKILLSVIGIGDGIDGESLARLAAWAQGKWWFEDSMSRLDVILKIIVERLLTKP